MMPTLEALLVQADFVTIHLPRTSETEGLIGEHELSLMKPGARLVNTARGGIVDEDALAKALDGGHLGGAALDVFAVEPTTDSPLFGSEHVGRDAAPGRVHARGAGQGGHHGRRDGPAGAPRRVRPVRRERVGGRGGLRDRPAVRAARGAARARCSPGSPRAGVRSIVCSYLGRIAEADTRVLTLAILKGILGKVVNEPVSFVNAPMLARERGHHGERDALDRVARTT